MSMNLLLALYLVFPRYLFNMGPGFMLSRSLEILRIDRCLPPIPLTHGNLAVVHQLMKYVDPVATNRAHPNLDNYSSCKLAAGLKTLLVE